MVYGKIVTRGAIKRCAAEVNPCEFVQPMTSESSRLNPHYDGPQRSSRLTEATAFGNIEDSKVGSGTIEAASKIVGRCIELHAEMERRERANRKFGELSGGDHASHILNELPQLPSAYCPGRSSDLRYSQRLEPG